MYKFAMTCSLLFLLAMLNTKQVHSNAALPNFPAALPNGPVGNYANPEARSQQQPVYEHEHHHGGHRGGGHEGYRDNYYVAPIIYTYPYYSPYYIITGSPDDSSYVNPAPSYATPRDEAVSPIPPTPPRNARQYWISKQNGAVPDNALVLTVDMNGNKAYYCRTNYKDTIYQGVLVEGEGCYVKDNDANIRFDSYEVLVQSE